MAPFLSIGLLSFPHFGEYMHDGHPTLQLHSSTNSKEVPTISLNNSYAFSESPIPPSNPSYMNTVGFPVEG